MKIGKIVEERYHVIRRQYKEEAFKIFPELLGVLASGCIRAVKVGNYEDCLGELYMTWERRTSVTDSFYANVYIKSDGKTGGN